MVPGREFQVVSKESVNNNWLQEFGVPVVGRVYAARRGRQTDRQTDSRRCILAVCQSCNELRRSCVAVPTAAESITVTRQETNCLQGAPSHGHVMVTSSDACTHPPAAILN